MVYKQEVFFPAQAAEEAAPLPGSYVAFAVNGVPQGRAYVDLLEGTYFPAVSLYTHPRQAEPARVTVAFGGEHAPAPLAHAPASALPQGAAEAPAPMGDLPGPRPPQVEVVARPRREAAIAGVAATVAEQRHIL